MRIPIKTDAFFVSIIGMLCFGLILFLNLLTPWLADDFWFRQRAACQMSFGELCIDAVRQANLWYRIHEGSWTDTFLAHLVINHPRYIAATINAIFTMAVLASAFLVFRRKYDMILSLSWTLLIPLLMPKPYQTMIWIPGTEHYLWPLFFGFLIWIFAVYGKSDKDWFVWLLALPSAFLAGMAHGSMGGVFFLLLLGEIFHRKFIAKERVPIWMIICLVVMLLGMLSMVIAPGNFARLARSQTGDTTYWHSSLTRRILINILEIIPYYSMGICIVIGALGCSWSKHNWRDADTFKSLSWFFAGIAGIIALLIVPVSIRATSFFPVCLLVSLSYSIKGLTIIPKTRGYGKSILCLVFIIFAIVYAHRITQANVIRRYARQREQVLEQAGKEGRKSVQVVSFISWKLFLEHTGFVGDLERPEHQNNVGLAEFYGIDKIHTIDWTRATGIME